MFELGLQNWQEVIPKMKISISNLAWGKTSLLEAVKIVENVGLSGIEIAPTALWPNLYSVTPLEIKRTREILLDSGLRVSGIQSLLYGHPEFQLFDKSTWPELRKHIEIILEIAENLETKVAVFGSPKNRVKGRLKKAEADLIAAEFFSTLLPVLERSDVVLTLEPNAPEYGADYLTSYAEVQELSDLIGSLRVAPQIDTGCMWMVGEDLCQAFESRIPHHIHISNPNLGEVPGSSNYDHIFELIKTSEYSGWLVIETLNQPPEKIMHASKWLVSKMRGQG